MEIDLDEIIQEYRYHPDIPMAAQNLKELLRDDEIEKERRGLMDIAPVQLRASL